MRRLPILLGVAMMLAGAFPTGVDAASVKKMVNIGPSGEVVLSGALKSMTTTSLVVSSWGGDWIINLSPSGKIIRKSADKSGVTEFMVGDALQIHGKASSLPWTIEAKIVQDNSIQKSDSSFSGVVSGLSGNTMTIATKKHGAVRVAVNADAKIMKGTKVMALKDIVNGSSIAVSGAWNPQHSLIMASKVVIMK